MKSYKVLLYEHEECKRGWWACLATYAYRPNREPNRVVFIEAKNANQAKEKAITHVRNNPTEEQAD